MKMQRPKNLSRFFKARRGRPRIRPVVWMTLAAGLLTAMVLAAMWGEFRHVLERRPQWISTKPSLERGLVGAVAYTGTPLALAGHRLNIGAWNGFQEVLFRKPVAPREITFDLELPDFSFFSFIFNKTPHGCCGVRLSRNPATPHLCFTADPSGAFLTKMPFTVDLHQQSHFQFKAVFGPGLVDIFLNGEPVTRFQGALADVQQIGFRSGPWDVFIDHFKLTDAGGHTYRDGFGSLNHFPLECLLIFLVLIIPLAVLYRRRGNRPAAGPGRGYLYYLAGCLVMIVLAGLLYGALRWRFAGDYGYAAGYFQVRNQVLGVNHPIELKNDVVARLDQEYASRYAGQRHRIMFIGTSQTWGAGASRNGLDWVSLVQQYLDQVTRFRKYECINTGISAEDASSLFDLYETRWIGFEPQTTVINLGNNDRDPGRFEQILKKFLALNQKKGIRTIFVLEANDVYAPSEHIEKNHIIMSNLAQERGVPLIDLHGFLGDHRDTGFQWWDFVHFTDYGHQLAAQIVFNRLAAILKLEKAK